MKVSRQKLRPWLEGILNQGDVPGTFWIDKEAMKFRLPWPRVNDDENPYRQIFEKWATHNGKYRQGIDNKEFSKWKARLRCAMNKAKDINFIKGESRPDDPENPFNIYCFTNMENENEVNKMNFFESECERRHKSMTSCLPVIQMHNTQSSITDYNPEQLELPADLCSIESSDLMSMGASIDIKKYLSEMPEKLDSLQIRDSNPCFEVYVEIDFGDILKFEEKLESFNCGFLISPEKSECEGKYDRMQIIQLDMLELNKEFSPGLILSVDGGSIYGHSLVQAPLFCKKVGSKDNITQEFIIMRSNDKVLLLKDQDNPIEQVRKVIISKSEGVFAIAIGTKLLPDFITSKECDVVQSEINELHSLPDKVVETPNLMEIGDASPEDITFDDFNIPEFSIGYSNESCMHSSLNN